MNKFGFFISFLGTLSFAATSFAADVPEAFLACANETNDLHRLVCYDEAMRAALAESPPETPPEAAAPAAAPVAVAEPQAAAKPESAPAPVAQTEEAAATPVAASAPADAKPPEEQSFVVREVFQQPRGENGVVLENGDVWQEPTASRYFPVKPGDRVTIKKRMFGGYRLITESGKAFSVSKVR